MFIEAVREWRQSDFASNLREPQGWLFDAFGASRTSAGISVGPRSALESTPFLRGCRLICESLSSVPLNELEQLAESRQKRILRTDPVHWLVHAEPNEMMSSAVLRQVAQLHALTYGSGYIFIERNAATRRPLALLPLAPESTHAQLEKGRFFYETLGDDGRMIQLSPADVLCIPWLSWDGLRAESPARIGKRSLGLGIAAEESGARFFGQGMLPSVVIEQAPNTSLKAEGLENLKAAIKAQFTGKANWWSPLILQPGLTTKQLSVNPDDAQAKELRELNVSDVARLLGVPLHLLAAGDKTSTYASVEQFELIYVKHTMLPWFFLWEQELNRKLLFPEERATRFFKFNLEGLLRGDKQSRAAANEIEQRGGALTVNEWRDLEDRDPSDIPEADKPLIMASQLAPLDQVGRPVEPPAGPAAPRREQELMRRLYEQQARRCVRQLTDSAARVAEKFKDNRDRFEAELRDAVNRIADDFADVFERKHFDWFERQVREAAEIAVVLEFWKGFGTDILIGRTQ